MRDINMKDDYITIPREEYEELLKIYEAYYDTEQIQVDLFSKTAECTTN